MPLLGHQWSFANVLNIRLSDTDSLHYIRMHACRPPNKDNERAPPLVSPPCARPVVPPHDVKQALAKLREAVSRGRGRVLELQLESQTWIARKQQELKVRESLHILLQHGYIAQLPRQNFRIWFKNQARLLQSTTEKKRYGTKALHHHKI